MAFKTKGTKNGESQNPDRWHIQMSKSEHAAARAVFERLGGANVAYLLETVARQLGDVSVEQLAAADEAGKIRVKIG